MLESPRSASLCRFLRTGGIRESLKHPRALFETGSILVFVYRCYNSVVINGCKFQERRVGVRTAKFNMCRFQERPYSLYEFSMTCISLTCILSGILITTMR